MIGKAKAVAHGLATLRYISGESANKKHPEKIMRIADFHMPQGMDAEGMWSEMQFAAMYHPNLKNSLLHIALSPPKKYTEGFTSEDYINLWRDFLEEFDKQVIYDKNGNVISGRTNLAGSKATLWKHEESKGEIPHLHAAVSRVDEDGNVNNDHAIHMRAQRAAEAVARKRGWTTARQVRGKNIPKVSGDCLDALRRMPSWSWDDYVARLEAKGYDVRLRVDTGGLVRGYVLKKGTAKYKASELGKGRNLTASKIEDTWKELHAIAQRQQEPAAQKPSAATAPTGVRKPAAGASLGLQQPVPSTPALVQEDYRLPSDGRLRTEFKHGGRTYHRYIPSRMLDFLNDEYDYREAANWQDLQHLALAFFTLVANPYVAPSGGGGGGSQSDRGWGRDPKEDELEFARRCARMASQRIPKEKKSGVRR